MSDSEVNRAEEISFQSELHSLLEQEEIKWKQRAREDWLKFGSEYKVLPRLCQPKKPEQTDFKNCG
jgi:hypothetical protein